MGGWIAFPQGLIGRSDPRREGELRRTSWRTSSPSPKPPQADQRGGRSLHDGPSGASPAGRVNGPQGRIFLPGGLEGFAAPLYRCGFGHLAGTAGHRRRRAPPLGERLRAPHHLGAPGTLRRMCAYLPAPLRPPEGESVNPPTLSPLADLAHHLVQASVLLDRLPITLRDRLAEGVRGIFVSAVLADPGRQHLAGPGQQRLLQEHGIAAVPHGFRSTFRDWAAEETDHPREVIEAALAHVVRNRVEAAYARSDLFERRRVLMDDWARYLAQGTGEDPEPLE